MASFEADSNIDRRLLVKLRGMTEWLSAGEPNRALVFRLGHVRTSLGRYLGMVDEEWPRLAAAEFYALLEQMDRVLTQSGPWRDLLPRIDTTVVKGREGDAAIVVGTFAQAMEEHALDLVDSEIRDALRSMANDMQDEIESGRESQALFYDGLESLSNVLKKMIEPLLRSAQSAGRWSGSTGRSALNAFSKSASASVIEEAARLGDRVGPAVTWVLRAFCVAAAMRTIPFVFHDLFQRFPKIFAWLESLLPMLREWLHL